METKLRRTNPGRPLNSNASTLDTAPIPSHPPVEHKGVSVLGWLSCATDGMCNYSQCEGLSQLLYSVKYTCYLPLLQKSNFF